MSKPVLNGINPCLTGKANMQAIRQNIEKLDYPIQEDIHRNPNSMNMEFSLRDPDGYYLTITDFHEYEG